MLKSIAFCCAWAVYLGAFAQPHIRFQTPENREVFPTGSSIYALIEVDESDNDVEKVVFYLNNQQIGVKENPPFQWGKDEARMQNLEVGTYTLRAIAYNAAGDSTEIAQKLFIQEPKYPSVDPPEVYFVTPADGALFPFGADAPVKVFAADAETNIEYVRLFVDDSFVGELTRYPYQWEDHELVKTLSDGTYILRAEALNYGGVVQQAEVVIHVATQEASATDSTDFLYLDLACATVGDSFEWPADTALGEQAFVETPFCHAFQEAASSDTAQWVRFSFTAPTSNTYTLWGRTQALNHSRDSYWVRWNEGAWIRWDHMYHTTDFRWNRVNDAEKGFEPLAVTLEAEKEYTLDLAQREGGTRLETLCLSRRGFVPEGDRSKAVNCIVANNPSTNLLEGLPTWKAHLAPSILSPGEIPHMVIESESYAQLQLSLVDMQGRIHWRNTWQLLPGIQEQQIPLNDLSAGLYQWVMQTTEGEALTLSMMVR